MNEIEIVVPLELTDDQVAAFEMHSILNVLHVLVMELDYLGILANNDDILEASVKRVHQWADTLRYQYFKLDQIVSLKMECGAIASEVQSYFNQLPNLLNHPKAIESSDNIVTVLEILSIRADEIIARGQSERDWLPHDVVELKQKFTQVFSAIEKNSKGRFHFTYNIAAQDVKDYYIDFKIESENNTIIYMPPVFQDVMRDLIANARKYTQVGGRISGGIKDNGKNLSLVVEDNGRGIPENEIEKVVQFGMRASNVLDKRTLGGGFGLTKAYFMTKKFDGRFWIRSSEGIGTCITIVIPYPNHVLE